MRLDVRTGAAGSLIALALGACLAPADSSDPRPPTPAPAAPPSSLPSLGVFSRLGFAAVPADPGAGVPGAVRVMSLDREHFTFYALSAETGANVPVATAANPSIPYTTLNGAQRTCRLQTANVCQALDGTNNQACVGTACETLLLAEITGHGWSEVWLQIDSLPQGWVVAGDNRSLLAPGDWRVSPKPWGTEHFNDSVDSAGAWRFGSVLPTTTVGSPGPYTIELDLEFDYGPGVTNIQLSPPFSVWGIRAPSGYDLSAQTGCTPVPLPTTGTTTIFPTAAHGETPQVSAVLGGLPFPFTLYNVTDTALWASFDGVFGLGPAPATAVAPYGALPVASPSRGLIMPQWAHTEGKTAAPLGEVVGFPSPATSPTSYVISATGIRWVDPGSVLLDYQVILNQNGSIHFLYPGGRSPAGSTTLDTGSRWAGTSGIAPEDVLLGAPVGGSPNYGATIGIQGAVVTATQPVSSVTPFTLYGSGGVVSGTGTGVAQQCYVPGSGTCASPQAKPTLLPGSLLAGGCYEIDFTPR